MHLLLVLQLVILLILANGAPIMAKRALGKWLIYPLDGGLTFWDGRRILGPSKTVRGVAVSMLLTSALAPLIGISWRVGLLIAIGSMIGDAVSSFLKRRLNLDPSTMALTLDQVPESMVPLLACRMLLPLTLADIIGGVVIFLLSELLLSQLLFRLNIRDRPF